MHNLHLKGFFFFWLNAAADLTWNVCIIVPNWFYSLSGSSDACIISNCVAFSGFEAKQSEITSSTHHNVNLMLMILIYA